jgi:hypothetical protein
MIDQLIEIIKTWHVLFQFFLLFGMAFMAMVLSVSVLGYIGEFFTETLPILFRGYPPNKQEELDDKDD